MSNDNFGSPYVSYQPVYSTHYTESPAQYAKYYHTGIKLDQTKNRGNNWGRDYGDVYAETVILDTDYAAGNIFRHYGDGLKIAEQKVGNPDAVFFRPTGKVSPIQSVLIHNIVIHSLPVFYSKEEDKFIGIDMPFEIGTYELVRTYNSSTSDFEEVRTFQSLLTGIAKANDTIDAISDSTGHENDLELRTDNGRIKLYIRLRPDFMTDENKNLLQDHYDFRRSINYKPTPMRCTISFIHTINKIVKYTLPEGYRTVIHGSSKYRQSLKYNNKTIGPSQSDPDKSGTVAVGSDASENITTDIEVSTPLAVTPEDKQSSKGPTKQHKISIISSQTDTDHGYVAVYRKHNLSQDIVGGESIFKHNLTDINPSNAKDLLGTKIMPHLYDRSSEKYENLSAKSNIDIVNFNKINDYRIAKDKLFINPLSAGPRDHMKSFDNYSSLRSDDSFNLMILSPTITFGEATDLKNKSEFEEPARTHNQHGTPILYEIKPCLLKSKTEKFKVRNVDFGTEILSTTTTSFDSFTEGESTYVWVEPDLPPECPVALNWDGGKDVNAIRSSERNNIEKQDLSKVTTRTIGFDAQFWKLYDSIGRLTQQTVEVFLPRTRTLKDLLLNGLEYTPASADPLTIKYDITIKAYDQNSELLYETTDTVTQDDNDIKHFSANGIQNIEDTHTYTSSTNGVLKPVIPFIDNSGGRRLEPRSCRFGGQYAGMLSNTFNIPLQHVIADKNADDDPSVPLRNGRVEVFVSISYTSNRGGSRDLGVQQIGGSKQVDNAKRIKYFQRKRSSSGKYNDGDYQFCNFTDLINYSPIPPSKTFIVASSTSNSVTLNWTEDTSKAQRQMEFVDQYKLTVYEYPVFSTNFRATKSGNFIVNPKAYRKQTEHIIEYDVDQYSYSKTISISSNKGYEFRLQKRSSLNSDYVLKNRDFGYYTYEAYSQPFSIQHIPAGAGGTGIRPPVGVTNSSPDINNNITDFYIWDARFSNYSWQQGTLNRNLEYGSSSRRGMVTRLKNNLNAGVMHVAVNCFADDLTLALRYSTDGGVTYNALDAFTKFSYEPMPKRVQKPSGFTNADLQPVSIFHIPALVGNINGSPVNIFTYFAAGTKFKFELFSAKLSAAYGTGDGTTPIKLKGNGGTEYTGGWQATAVTYKPVLANSSPVTLKDKSRRDVPSDPSLREGIALTKQGQYPQTFEVEKTFTYDRGSSNFNFRYGPTYKDRYQAHVVFDVEFAGNHPDTQLSIMAVNVNNGKNPIGLKDSQQQLRWPAVYSPIVTSPAGQMANTSYSSSAISVATPSSLRYNRQTYTAGSKGFYNFDKISMSVKWFNDKEKNGMYRKKFARVAVSIYDELAQALYDLRRIDGSRGFYISDSRLHSRSNPKNIEYTEEDYNIIKSLLSNYGIIIKATTDGVPSSNDMGTYDSATYRTNLYNLFQHFLEAN